ncbi:MAG: FeS-containing oxidoreductase [Cyanobacteria bacterium RYN_339]|nr:FeS-containing oxidoreductase [Cyanobacteria bacterium RYN_339]
MAVNGKVLRDIIDYRYEITEEVLRLRVKRDDQLLTFDVEKEMDEDLGLAFELAVFDNIIECHNRCSFCFIHQMARGLRQSLYIMDDDYRLSFLQGNFVTLTNMKPADWKRIYQDRLSPLNVSVHSTNPKLREEMIKHPRAGQIMAELRRLAKHDIDVNVQVVFCPGFNDGAELDRTLRDLEKLVPHVRSVAIVPVGLSQFRKYLPQLTPVSKEQARQAIAQVRGWQQRFRDKFGDPIVRLGDEFYLIAEMPLPGNGHYGEYDQLGDGVGGAALIAHEFKRLERHLPARLAQPRRVTVVTGQAGERIMAPLVARLNQVENLEVRLRTLASPFWGPMITVTGLLTYQDLVDQLQGEDLGERVVISKVMLKDGSAVTLDGKTVPEIAAGLGVPVDAVENSAFGLFEGALGMAAPRARVAAYRYGNPYEPNSAVPLGALN